MRPKKTTPKGYARNATWRDVLAGNPVTKKERKEAKGRKPKPLDRPGLCRNCGRTVRIKIAEWYRAAPPKCFRCGGVLDRLRDTGQGERP